MTRIYYDKNADLSVLKGKTVAVIGYGIQGRGQALNLRDSGISVLVAQRPGGPNYTLAKQDGFKPVSGADAAAKADIIILLAQGMLQVAEVHQVVGDVSQDVVGVEGRDLHAAVLDFPKAFHRHPLRKSAPHLHLFLPRRQHFGSG